MLRACCIGLMIFLVATTVFAEVSGQPLGNSVKPKVQGLRYAIVPLVPQTSGRVDSLYTALRAEGMLVIGPKERMGVDQKGSDLFLRSARVDDVRALLQKSQNAMRAFELESANNALLQAREALFRLARPSDHKSLIADVILSRSTLLLTENKNAEAQKELILLSRLDPELDALHPGLHPPDLVKAYTEARDLARQGQKALLTFTTNPADARVLLDGEPALANQPIEVLPGPHVLTLLADGRWPNNQVLDLQEGEVQNVYLFAPPKDAVEERAKKIIAFSQDRQASDAQVLASLVGADVLVFLSPDATMLWSNQTSFLKVAGDTSLEKARSIRSIMNRRNDERGEALEDDGNLLGLALGGAAALVVASATAVTIWFLLGDEATPGPRPVIVGIGTK